MAKNEISLVPYEHTLYDTLIGNIKGKYLQNMVAPHLIAQIPEKNGLGIHYIEDGRLSVWFPIEERWGDISLNEFSQYVIINEEQFKSYQDKKNDLSNIVLAHKDASIFKEEKNKPNLSANFNFNELNGDSENILEHYKSDAFSGRSVYPTLSNFAETARQINETAKKNKPNLSA